MAVIFVAFVVTLQSNDIEQIQFFNYISFIYKTKAKIFGATVWTNY